MSGLIRKSRLPSFHDRTPAMVYGTTSSTTDVSILNVSGKGFLTSISGASASDSQGVGQGYATIMIDGVQVYSGFICGWSAPLPIHPLYRFETSLQVLIKSSSGTIYAVASYILD